MRKHRGLAGRLAASLARGATLASSRFPVAAALVVFLSLVLNAGIADISILPDATVDVWSIAIFTAAAVSVLVRLSLEARGAGTFALSLGPLAAAVSTGFVVRYAEPLGVNAPALVASLTLAVPLAPFVGRSDNNRFWTFVLWTFVGIVLAFLAVLLFALGLTAILAMVRFLFEVHVSSDAYEHIFATALTLVGPLMALGRVPTDFDETTELSAGDRMAQGVRLLVDWVAAPLALATALVLHLYAAKIILIGALPRNEVGWIVTSYALFVLSLRVAADPFLRDGRLFTRGFARAWAWLLVMPLALLGMAAAQRISAEGWTVERYYLALGGLAIGVCLAAQLVARFRANIRLMAAIPLTLLALSSFGPLGVADVVGRSQSARLGALLDGTGRVQPGRANEARSRIQALSEVDELARMAELLPLERRRELATATGDRDLTVRDAAERAIGAGPEIAPPETATKVFASTGSTILAINGFDIALTDRTILRGGSGAGIDGVTAFLDGSDLVLAIGASTRRFTLRPLLSAVTSEAFESAADDTDPVTLDLSSAEGHVVRLALQRFVVEGDAEIVQATGTILLRKADWPGSSLFGGGPKSGIAQPGGAVGERTR
ncbi:hypothetical protein ASG43_08700 [Aureimonas sp. Leaf454]|uniref:DUF4153 domain-containing protein n=1 Tax=Aureimonas sp. Leaf454 TaxID=1736381 RepID=UPI0006FF821A|nr:DUF4153 domain-containing protein [Aureimonas sp. Leaf454]KQT48909.1 hypothetical protein ASG43_08700 [Aureimonas sp. Leaf454]